MTVSIKREALPSESIYLKYLEDEESIEDTATYRLCENADCLFFDLASELYYSTHFPYGVPEMQNLIYKDIVAATGYSLHTVKQEMKYRLEGCSDPFGDYMTFDYEKAASREEACILQLEGKPEALYNENIKDALEVCSMWGIETTEVPTTESAWQQLSSQILRKMWFAELQENYTVKRRSRKK